VQLLWAEKPIRYKEAMLKRGGQPRMKRRTMFQGMI